MYVYAVRLKAIFNTNGIPSTDLRALIAETPEFKRPPLTPMCVAAILPDIHIISTHLLSLMEPYMLLPAGLLYTLTGIAAGVSGLCYPPHGGVRRGLMWVSISVAIVFIFWGLRIDMKQAELLQNQATSLTSQGEALVAQQTTALLKLETAERQRDLAETQLTAARVQIAAVQADATAALLKLKTAERQRNSAETQLSALRNENATTHETLRMTEQQLTSTQSDLTAARDQIATLSDELAQTKSELSAQVAKVGSDVEISNATASRMEATAKAEAKADEARRQAQALFATRTQHCFANKSVMNPSLNTSLLAGGGCACGRYYTAAEKQQQPGMVLCSDGSMQSIQN